MEAVENGDVELIPINQQKPDISPPSRVAIPFYRPVNGRGKRKRKTFSVLCIVFTILLVLVVTAVSAWGLPGRYNPTGLKHADIENIEWLQILSNWKPIANDVIATADFDADVCSEPYRWACGGYLDSTSIPSGSYYVSKAITSIRNTHNRVLRSVVEEDWPLISPYFTSCNESWAVSNFSKISEFYDAIQNITSKHDLFAILGSLRRNRGLRLADFAFRIGVQSDPHNSTARLITFEEAENTLPSPVYYSSEGEVDLESYQRYIASMFSLTPIPINSEEANEILTFETQVAAIMSGIDTLGMSREYTRHSLDNARQVLGEILVAYVDNFDYIKREYVEQGVFLLPSNFFPEMVELIESTPLTTLKNLALFSLFKQTYPLLGAIYFNTNRGLDGILNGVAVHSITTHDRENFCIRSTVNSMPMLMGHYYVVAAGINSQYKKHVAELVQFTRESFSARLDKNTWMDTATRVAAEQKLQRMSEQICYPDSWDSVLEFEQTLNGALNPNDYFENALRINRVNDQIQFGSVLKPVDRADWGFEFLTKLFLEGPEIINAFYSPSMNRITIAAGMAQPPFLYSYDWKEAPLPATFGGLVSIIGHEITHGFDNQGAQFNSNGELENWWSDASQRQFGIDSQCIAESRSRVQTQIPGVYLNGNLVLGESIADLGGIETALDAMELWESTQLSSEELQLYDSALYEVFPGFSKHQLFYLFFMQNYCELQTDESVYAQVSSDPHPPGKQRVEALLVDVARFSEAFNCKSNTKFNPQRRCKLW